MENRSNIFNDSERVKKEIPVRKKKITTKKLRLLKNIKLNITGKVTGKKYTFNGGGAIVDVDSRDADIMINKVSGKKCCPGTPGATPYFEFVEER